MRKSKVRDAYISEQFSLTFLQAH